MAASQCSEKKMAHFKVRRNMLHLGKTCILMRKKLHLALRLKVFGKVDRPTGIAGKLLCPLGIFVDIRLHECMYE